MSREQKQGLITKGLTWYINRTNGILEDTNLFISRKTANATFGLLAPELESKKLNFSGVEVNAIPEFPDNTMVVVSKDCAFDMEKLIFGKWDRKTFRSIKRREISCMTAIINIGE
jgi:hypothetical protein